MSLPTGMKCADGIRMSAWQMCIRDRYGMEHSSYPATRDGEERKNSHPFLSYRPELCIHCQRCVGTCEHVTGRKAIGLGKTGVFNIIEAPFGPDWKTTLCESCGRCV